MTLLERDRIKFEEGKEEGREEEKIQMAKKLLVCKRNEYWRSSITYGINKRTSWSFGKIEIEKEK